MFLIWRPTGKHHGNATFRFATTLWARINSKRFWNLHIPLPANSSCRINKVCVLLDHLHQKFQETFKRWQWMRQWCDLGAEYYSYSTAPMNPPSMASKSSSLQIATLAMFKTLFCTQVVQLLHHCLPPSQTFLSQPSM